MNISLYAGNVSNTVPSHNCCEERDPDQLWHCVLVNISGSCVLAVILYALQFCKAVLPGTKKGFEFNYMSFEMENS